MGRVWCCGRSSGIGLLASGNEFGRSELASSAGVGPEGPWQTRFEGQLWLENTSKDPACGYSKTNVQSRFTGTWDLSLSRQRGRDPRTNTPGWGQLGGLAVVCLYFALCLFPVTATPGMKVAWLSLWSLCGAAP